MLTHQLSPSPPRQTLLSKSCSPRGCSQQWEAAQSPPVIPLALGELAQRALGMLQVARDVPGTPW